MVSRKRKLGKGVCRKLAREMMGKILGYVTRRKERWRWWQQGHGGDPTALMLAELLEGCERLCGYGKNDEKGLLEEAERRIGYLGELFGSNIFTKDEAPGEEGTCLQLLRAFKDAVRKSSGSRLELGRDEAEPRRL